MKSRAAFGRFCVVNGVVSRFAFRRKSFALASSLRGLSIHCYTVVRRRFVESAKGNRLSRFSLAPTGIEPASFDKPVHAALAGELVVVRVKSQAWNQHALP